jgi:hypothetical protein
MKGPLLIAFSLLLWATFLTLPATAQRRRRPEPLPPPVELTFAPDPTPGAPSHRWIVALRASAEVEILADRRLLWLEVLPEGARRPIRCEVPARPRRPDASRLRTLQAGETWGEWFDIRSVCWGAAFRAFETGADVTAHFGSPRWRTIVVARNAAGSWREVVQASTLFPGYGDPVLPESDVRVSLADVDVGTGARLSFRVSVRASRAVRAWIRPDRFSFRVLAPDGSTHVCSISRGGGAGIPDLFARLSVSRGAQRTLDARQFCGPDVFALEGIYEVTPVLDLDVSGAQWRMDTPLGRFEGAPAVVRIRSGQRGYVERPTSGTS